MIAKHIPIAQDKVMVKLDRGVQMSTLEIDIEMPTRCWPRTDRSCAQGASCGGACGRDRASVLCSIRNKSGEDDRGPYRTRRSTPASRFLIRASSARPRNRP